jgi:hypothetical protein
MPGRKWSLKPGSEWLNKLNSELSLTMPAEVFVIFCKTDGEAVNYKIRTLYKTFNTPAIDHEVIIKDKTYVPKRRVIIANCCG